MICRLLNDIATSGNLYLAVGFDGHKECTDGARNGKVNRNSDHYILTYLGNIFELRTARNFEVMANKYNRDRICTYVNSSRNYHHHHCHYY
jgi:hypothetical protein